MISQQDFEMTTEEPAGLTACVQSTFMFPHGVPPRLVVESKLGLLLNSKWAERHRAIVRGQSPV